MSKYHPQLEDVEPTHESLEEALNDVFENGKEKSNNTIKSRKQVVVRSDTDLEIYCVYKKLVVYDDGDISVRDTPVPYSIPEPEVTYPFQNDLDALVEESKGEIVQMYSDQTGKGPVEYTDEVMLYPDYEEPHEWYIHGAPGACDDWAEWKQSFALKKAEDQLEDGNVVNAANLLDCVGTDVVSENASMVKEWVGSLVAQERFAEARDLLNAMSGDWEKDFSEAPGFRRRRV